MPGGASPVRLLVLGMAALFVLSRAALSAPEKKPRRRDREGKLKVGDPAPDFNLKYEAADKKGSVKLSSFKGKQPVVLVFGSYT